MDYNPNLGAWTWPEHVDPAGQKTIDTPPEIGNIIWQNRSAMPTAYENALGDALENVFEAGAEKIEDVVAKLNELGVKDPQDNAWTEESFMREMNRLGA
jgi:hypothetical protein